MTRNSDGGRRIHRKPPCVMQGAGDCPGGISYQGSFRTMMQALAAGPHSPEGMRASTATQ